MAHIPKIVVSELDNGITCISSPNRNHNVSLTAARAGSAYDPQQRRGTGHLMEHEVMQKSSVHPADELDLLVLRLMGGWEGADIRTDYTSVVFGHGDLRSKRHLRQAFNAFAPAVRESILDARGEPTVSILDIDGHDSEKSAMHNEYRLDDTDVPENRVSEMLYENMWTTNPVRNRAGCNPDELIRVTLTDVKKFIRRWVAGRIFTVFVGLDHREARQLTEKHYGALKPSRVVEPDWSVFDLVPTLAGVRHIEDVHPGSHQHHVAIGFPTNVMLSRDDESLDILTAVWRYRLYRRLRLENRKYNGGVYRTNTEIERSFLHGIIYTAFGTVGSYDYAMHLAELVQQECDNLKRRMLSKNQQHTLDRQVAIVQRNLYDGFYSAFNDEPSKAANLLVHAFCNGDRQFKRLLQYPSRIKRLDRLRIQRVAETYMTTPDQMVRVVLKPLIIPGDVCDRAVTSVPEIAQYIDRFRARPAS